LTSKERELPEKFSDHLSYSNKQTLSQGKEKGKARECGFLWAKLGRISFPSTPKGTENLGFCSTLRSTLAIAMQ
jgi:hypothetical protein